MLSLNLGSAHATAASTCKGGSAPRGATPRNHGAKARASTPRSATKAKSGPARSPTPRSAFMRAHPCPCTGNTSGACPGYVVDHAKPLACGSTDRPSNMQWQRATAGKAKDRVERRGC